MDDELENLVISQTFQTYLKYFKTNAKFLIGFNSFSSSTNFWKIMKIQLMKPEILIFIGVLFVFILYLQVMQLYASEKLSRFSPRFGQFFAQKTTKSTLSLGGNHFKGPYWQEKSSSSSVFAIQGRRPKMEDRFFMDENINNTGVSVFAIFDGHGGIFAADFCRNHLVMSIYNKIIETIDVLNGKTPPKAAVACNNDNDKKEENKENAEDNKTPAQQLTQRRKSFKKSLSQEDYDSTSVSPGLISFDSDIYGKLNQQRGPITKETLLNRSNSNKGKKDKEKPKVQDAHCYIDKGVVNFGKLLNDLVLAADYDLVEKARKESNVAGSTALIALMHKTNLVVANVGDSRGVMCDSKFNAIPLSFDHKPQQTREHKRIKENGGFIEFKGVWRVAGILATSRAMGDYPLKVSDLVIADPDILHFDLAQHKPLFIVLASDGLFDCFSNEDVISFIRDRLDEPYFGAKSIVIESYQRGSVDNITVLVIVFKNGKYEIGSSAA